MTDLCAVKNTSSRFVDLGSVYGTNVVDCYSKEGDAKAMKIGKLGATSVSQLLAYAVSKVQQLLVVKN